MKYLINFFQSQCQSLATGVLTTGIFRNYTWSLPNCQFYLQQYQSHQSQRFPFYEQWPWHTLLWGMLQASSRSSQSHGQYSRGKFRLQKKPEIVTSYFSILTLLV